MYEEAKEAHPERWSREIRDWTYQEEEWLNPERKEVKETVIQDEAEAS